LLREKPLDVGPELVRSFFDHEVAGIRNTLEAGVSERCGEL